MATNNLVLIVGNEIERDELKQIQIKQIDGLELTTRERQQVESQRDELETLRQKKIDGLGLTDRERQLVQSQQELKEALLERDAKQNRRDELRLKQASGQNLSPSEEAELYQGGGGYRKRKLMKSKKYKKYKKSKKSKRYKKITRRR